FGHRLITFDTSSVVPLQSSSCRSPDPVNPSLFLPRSRPWLLAKAAEGGLEPAPASRLRGASPHQSNSCAPPQPFGCLLCSWHTEVGKPEGAGINRHVVGDERALRERRQRLHPGLESCSRHREMPVEA